MFSRRHTFMVKVSEPDGAPVLENLRTHERVVLTDLTDVGTQIDRWLHPPGPDEQSPGGGAPPPVDSDGSLAS
jgi:hypothetical protein